MKNAESRKVCGRIVKADSRRLNEPVKAIAAESRVRSDEGHPREGRPTPRGRRGKG